jgi:hypothetical protein
MAKRHRVMIHDARIVETLQPRTLHASTRLAAHCAQSATLFDKTQNAKHCKKVYKQRVIAFVFSARNSLAFETVSLKPISRM